MTKLEINTVNAIKKWCQRHRKKLTEPLRHIYPRAYVIAKPAPGCLVVSTPLVDAEPQVRKLKNAIDQDGSKIIYTFDKSLKPGDWCSMAYGTFGSSSELIAIPVVSK